MNVRVLMFGGLGEVARTEDWFDLAEPVTAGDVLSAVRDRFPGAGPILDRVCVAVDDEVVDASHRVRSGAEVALLPPMSGGASTDVALTLDPSVARAHAHVSSSDVGGIVLFVGHVRDTCDAGPVDALEYSSYESMALSVMEAIANEAIDKWGLAAVAIEHAVGRRAVGEVTFIVACAAAHRAEAFAASEYVVDEVKARAPIWKKECGPWGERWIGL